MLGTVVLVLQFADDLFDGVFDGDQAGDAAVFIHDDSHMLAGALHLVEQVVDRLGFGHQHRVTDDGFDIAGYRRGIERRGAHGILQVCHADQIIHIIADDRYTGESGTGAQFQHVLQRLPAFDANHISARHHDLTRQRFGQRQYVAQHFGNLRVEIIRLDQTIYGGAPLFELDFFKLLIVRQIIRMTFRILLSADFSEWRQSHRDRRRIGMLQHQIDRFGGARATWTDQQRNHRDHQREHEADKQSRP